MYTKIRNKTGFFFGGGGISNFLERDKEGLPKFLTDEGGEERFFFLHLVKKEALFCGFFLKEDHP